MVQLTAVMHDISTHGFGLIQMSLTGSLPTAVLRRWKENERERMDTVFQSGINISDSHFIMQLQVVGVLCNSQ